MTETPEDAKLSPAAQTALTVVNGALDRAEADLAKVRNPDTTSERKAQLTKQYINVLKGVQLSWQDAPEGTAVALAETVPAAPGMREWQQREERLQRAWLDFMEEVKASQDPDVQTFINNVRKNFAQIDQLRAEGKIQ